MTIHFHAPAARRAKAGPQPLGVLLLLGNDRPKADTIQVLRMVRRMDRARVRMVVAFLDRPSGRPGPAGECAGTIPDELTAAGADVVHWPRGRGLCPSAVTEAARFVRRRDIDLLHSIYLRADLFAARLASRTGRAWVAMLGGIGAYRRTRLRPGAALLDLAIYRRADHLIAVSDAVVDDWSARLHRPRADFTTLRLGVPAPPSVEPAADLFGPDAGAAPTVLCVSRLDREKGVEVLIESAALLTGRGVALRVLIAGDGAWRDRLTGLIAARNLQSTVKLLGERDDVWSLLAGADLFAMPSHMEGAPNALLEAAAAGVPIVASNVGGVPEQVRDGREALLTPPGDAEALADAIARLLTDRALARTLATEARERSARWFSAELMAQRHMELYERIAGAPAEPMHRPGRPRRADVCGLTVTALEESELVERLVGAAGGPGQERMHYLNAHVFNLAWRDERLWRNLRTCSLLWPDGISGRFACAAAGVHPRGRLGGYYFWYRLNDALARDGRRVFLLGGRGEVVAESADMLAARYGREFVAGFQDGYFGAAENDAVIDAINASGADVLTVGMGTPRQENWLADHAERLRPRLLWSVGALFDFMTGAEPPAPRAMRMAGLEWFWRLLLDPAAKARRYLVGNPLFVWRLLGGCAGGRVDA
ncbi:MAG: UDP-N-acetyl-D-mannosaminuronic acid transferase [Phycisphaerae bacterium]|nr:UDP-N-acetyl-D-mannosaminuronic acid transferase [Phycisphaerae bacterium]